MQQNNDKSCTLDKVNNVIILKSLRKILYIEKFD